MLFISLKLIFCSFTFWEKNLNALYGQNIFAETLNRLHNFCTELLWQFGYILQRNGQYLSLDSPVYLQSINVPGVCSFDIERRVTAFSALSVKRREIEGRNVFFRMKFLQYPSGSTNFSNTIGPFYYQGKCQS